MPSDALDWSSPPGKAEKPPQLHTGRTQRHGRRDALGIGDFAGSNNGHPDRLNHLRRQGERADLGAEVLGQKQSPMPAASRPWAMMASAPCCSSQRASSSVVAKQKPMSPRT